MKNLGQTTQVVFQRPAWGFTLLELLVVLVLAGLLLSLVSPALQRLVPGTEFRAFSRQLQAELRQARSLAILRQQAVRVSRDAQSGALLVSGEAKPLRLPAGFSLDIQRDIHGSPEEAAQFDTQGAISFYPQGYSSGGRLQLSGVEGQRSELQVDWLTGRVSRHD